MRLNQVMCPTCGAVGKIVDWYGNAECRDCGAQWNSRDHHARRMAEKRREYERRTGKNRWQSCRADRCDERTWGWISCC